MNIDHGLPHHYFTNEEKHSPIEPEGLPDQKEGNYMKVITIEFPQHPKIKGTVDIISDDFGFHYADIESHNGLQASFESDSIEYKLLLAACEKVSKYVRVIESIHNGNSLSEPSSKEQEGDAVGLLDWMAINHYREVGYCKDLKRAQFAQFEGGVCCSDYFSKEQLYQLYLKNKNL